MKKGIRKCALGLVFLSTMIVAYSSMATEHIVIIDDDDKFKPANLQIQLGDTVTWIHQDYTFAPHASISDDGFWDSGDMEPDDRFSITPPITGTFGYFDWWSDATGTITVVGGNAVPTITITNPAPDATFTAPASFTIQAEASDSDGTVAKVEFFVDGSSVGIDTTANPYSANVSELGAGNYVISAIATDSSGSAETNSINITVTNPAISLSAPKLLSGQLQFTISGLVTGKTNLVQTSTNLIDWNSVRTNVATGGTSTFTNTQTARVNFFRVIQLP